jgi:hypothetical protein
MVHGEGVVVIRPGRSQRSREWPCVGEINGLTGVERVQCSIAVTEAMGWGVVRGDPGGRRLKERRNKKEERHKRSGRSLQDRVPDADWSKRGARGSSKDKTLGTFDLLLCPLPFPFFFFRFTPPNASLFTLIRLVYFRRFYFLYL